MKTRLGSGCSAGRDSITIGVNCSNTTLLDIRRTKDEYRDYAVRRFSPAGLGRDRETGGPKRSTGSQASSPILRNGVAERVEPDEARHAVRMEPESLPGLRIRLPVLLRPLYARVHGTPRKRRLRRHDLRKVSHRSHSAP